MDMKSFIMIVPISQAEVSSLKSYTAKVIIFFLSDIYPSAPERVCLHWHILVEM